ncbi:MAG: tetratricopeptide repeat protein [Ignavibacteriae bacterium]|nr:tetratricopeptide repeat protein [Ignavibacteriota bacterium]
MSQTSEKKISGFQFSYIIIGLIGLGIFLLITAGLFDPLPKVISSVKNEQSIDQIHSGNNLNKLAELNSLEEEVKNNPEDYEKMISLAHQLNDSGFFEKAIVNYEKYLKKFPQNVNVIVDYGVCYYELQNFDKAISILKSALQIDSKHQIAHFNLGIINFAKKDLETARSWWEKTVEIDAHSDVGHKANELLNTQLRSK